MSPLARLVESTLSEQFREQVRIAAQQLSVAEFSEFFLEPMLADLKRALDEQEEPR